MNMPDPHNYNRVKSDVLKAFKPRVVNEVLLAFYAEYMRQDLEFRVSISDTINFKIKPYFGIILNNYDAPGQAYFFDIDFGAQQTLTASMPRALIAFILGDYLDPLKPEHFDDMFVCKILEMILVDLLSKIKQTTGIEVHFLPFSGSKGNFRTQWRLLADGHDVLYPVLLIGAQNIVKELLDKLYVYAKPKSALQPKVTLKIISLARKMYISQLRTLKPGEIIILMTKRHPINEPLVLIGNNIILHTVLQGMELHLTKDPSLVQDVEELHMTVQDNDIDAIDYDNEASPSRPHNNQSLAESLSPQNELDAALSDYKITVTFELGRLDIPAGIMSKMTKGSVLNLQKEITEDIFLTVSGRTIAVAEVVQVGRNFGVLIKEVFNG